MVAPTFIRSGQNPVLRRLRELRDDPVSERLWLEGRRLIDEAWRSGLTLEMLVATPEAIGSLSEIQQARARRVILVSAAAFKALSDLETPQGLLAVARRPAASWDELLAKAPAPVVILDGLQDPGNAAAIARTAEASGAAGLVTTPGTARLFSPKALRGAMGSTLRLPCLEHQSIENLAVRLRKAGYGLLGAQGKGDGPLYTKVDWTRAWGIVLGQEGQGLSAAWRPFLTQAVAIPMKQPVESLNVAAAAAVLLYESARRRVPEED